MLQHMEATETKLRQIEDKLEGSEETMNRLPDKKLLSSIKEVFGRHQVGKMTEIMQM